MSLITAHRRWNWRCSRESCKARYHGGLHPDDYKRGWKCKACGGTKFRIIKDMNLDRGQHYECTCSGYNWGGAPHRRGSPACQFNADGTIRLHIRTQDERLHPQAKRTIADRDQHGNIWWFYDGELEAIEAGYDDSSESEQRWHESMLELQSALAGRGQSGAPASMAKWMDGSTYPCHTAVGRLRGDSENLRRSRKAELAYFRPAHRRPYRSA